MDVFGSLALVFGLAALGGIIAKMLRQPALLGYVAVGAIISIFDLANVGSTKMVLDSMGQLGVTLLLFLVGLELPISELRNMGRVSLLIGLGQIVFTALVAYLLVLGLGFSMIAAMYLALAMVFSSTIIIVKLLSEKRDSQTLYGKIAIGTLLVQDFIAIGVLVVLSGLTQGNITWITGVWTIVKGVLLVTAALVLSTSVLPKTLNYLGKSTEILFVTAIAWCLVVAAFVASPLVGFSLEIGGFLAGLALANAVEHLQIVSRVRPLRDFFLTLFFVSLGSNIHLHNLGSAVWLSLLLSAFVLIGKPLIVMILMGWSGYKKRTSFLASLTMAQISEFSLIIIALAVRLGHVNEQILSITALVGVVTMTVSTYVNSYSEAIYRKISKYLSIFERKTVAETTPAQDLEHHVLLFGHSRTGSVLLPALLKLDKPVLVVDFNPNIIEKLQEKQINSVYGDLADHEIYDELNLNDADLVISTVPDVNDNLLMLSHLNHSKAKNRPVCILTAQDDYDAERLYAHRADYVLLPNAVGGEYLAQVFNHHGFDKKYIANLSPKKYHL